MIFGTTYKQDAAVEQLFLKIEYEHPYEKRFAWIPRQINDGRMVWLQVYYIKRDIILSKEGIYYDRGYVKDEYSDYKVYLTDSE